MSKEGDEIPDDAASGADATSEAGSAADGAASTPEGGGEEEAGEGEVGEEGEESGIDGSDSNLKETESKEAKPEAPSPPRVKSKDAPGESISTGTTTTPTTTEGKVGDSKTPDSKRRKRGRFPRRKKGEKVGLENVRVGFMGAGKMTEATVKGLITITKLDPKRLFITSRSTKNMDQFKQQGCYISKRGYDVFGKFDCDIVILAFPGHVIKKCFKTGGTRPQALTVNFIPNQRHPIYVLSLVGGIVLKDIKQTLLNPDNPEKYKLEMHRIMLNYSVAYGIGLAAIDVEPDSKKCSPLIRDLITSLARVEYIPETHMDVACAVGGNGLTFVYYFIGALADGAFKMGLPKAMATKIAAKTLQSASACLLESGKHPSDLRDACTSPSGPAIYGCHVLEKADCSSGVSGAVDAAYRRIKDMVDRDDSAPTLAQAKQD